MRALGKLLPRLSFAVNYTNYPFYPKILTDMGWRDLFKKKKSTDKVSIRPLESEVDETSSGSEGSASGSEATPPASDPPAPSSTPTAPAAGPDYRPGTWAQLVPFRQHLLHAVHIHSRGSTAPLGAYQKPDGSVTGALHVFAEGNEIYGEDAAVIVDRYEQDFAERLAAGEITGYVIIEHGFDTQAPETDGVMMVHYRLAGAGEQQVIFMPYAHGSEGIQYRGFQELSAEENQEYFATELPENGQLWLDQTEMVVPTETTATDVKVQRANQFDLRNLYAATVGYRLYNEEAGHNALLENVALALTLGPRATEGSVNRYAAGRTPLDVVVYKENMAERMKFFVPEVSTNVVIPTRIREITEWENFGAEMAIVNGRGKDTFGIPFLATDYALHRDRYRNATEPLDLHVAGIAFILKPFEADPDAEVKYADNFTAYMHTSQLPNYACVDVIAEVEAVTEVEALAPDQGPAYVLKLRLITQEDEPDFFTVDTYIVRESLQVPRPEVGMKLTGMVQLQGRLVEG